MKDGAYNSLTFIVNKIDNHQIYKNSSYNMVIKYHILPCKRKDIKLTDLKKAISFNKDDNTVVFYQDGYADLFFSNSDKEEPYLLEYMFKDYEIRKRIEIDKAVLNKRITVIGLGSVGSRVVLDLARAGFNNFYLVTTKGDMKHVSTHRSQRHPGNRGRRHPLHA